MTPNTAGTCCTTGFTSLQFQNRKSLGPSFFLQLQEVFKCRHCTGNSGLSYHPCTGQLGHTESPQAHPEPLCPILHRPSPLYYLSKAAAQLQPDLSFQLSQWLYKVQATGIRPQGSVQHCNFQGTRGADSSKFHTRVIPTVNSLS